MVLWNRYKCNVKLCQGGSSTHYSIVLQELSVDSWFTIWDMLPLFRLDIHMVYSPVIHMVVYRELTHFKEALLRCISPILPIPRGAWNGNWDFPFFFFHLQGRTWVTGAGNHKQKKLGMGLGFGWNIGWEIGFGQNLGWKMGFRLLSPPFRALFQQNWYFVSFLLRFWVFACFFCGIHRLHVNIIKLLHFCVFYYSSVTLSLQLSPTASPLPTPWKCPSSVEFVVATCLNCLDDVESKRRHN